MVGGGDDGGDDDGNEYMMMIKLSICCELVAQSEVHPKCCPSHSSTLSHSLSVQLIVVMMVMMMMKLRVCCELVVVAHYEVHNKCCLSHSIHPLLGVVGDDYDDDEAECLLWTCSTV